jgi:hypothetical protein
MFPAGFRPGEKIFGLAREQFAAERGKGFVHPLQLLEGMGVDL